MTKGSRSTKQKKQRHPYASYEKLTVWKIISHAIKDLVDNGDLELKTSNAHVVGYICKHVARSKPRAKS